MQGPSRSANDSKTKAAQTSEAPEIPGQAPDCPMAHEDRSEEAQRVGPTTAKAGRSLEIVPPCKEKIAVAIFPGISLCANHAPHWAIFDTGLPVMSHHLKPCLDQKAPSLGHPFRSRGAFFSPFGPHPNGVNGKGGGQQGEGWALGWVG